MMSDDEERPLIISSKRFDESWLKSKDQFQISIAMWVYTVLTEMQTKNKIKVHMSIPITHVGRSVASFLEPFGIRMKGEPHEVVSIHTKTKESMRVIEIILEKIPALKR